MQAKTKIFIYCYVFLSVFIVKMLISTAPVILDLDSKVVSAAIMQLELENETKDNTAAKQIKTFLKSGIDYIHFNCFSTFSLILNTSTSRYYISKKYLKTYFPRVPTPPPNFTC
jgi:hypothetical protein